MLTIAASNSAVIRVIDTTGTVLVNTSTPLRKDEPDVIENFDYAAFGPRYYEISSFFGQYSRDRLTVMYPVTANMRTRGYVAISVPVNTLDDGSRSLTHLAEILTLVNFILSLGILLLFGYAIYRPLIRITEGARAFSNGNMTHKINVRSRDEMGYLADTMNYMAGELKKNTDYQKNFISNVSHDFRSPLTSIKGYTEAMMDGTIPVEMHDRYLGIISKETERLEKLTKSILELNTMDAGKLALNYSDFDINGMLKNTAAFFEGTCRKKKITLNLVLTWRQRKNRAGHLQPARQRDQIQREEFLYSHRDDTSPEKVLCLHQGRGVRDLPGQSPQDLGPLLQERFLPRP